MRKPSDITVVLYCRNVAKAASRLADLAEQSGCVFDVVVINDGGPRQMVQAADIHTDTFSSISYLYVKSPVRTEPDWETRRKTSRQAFAYNAALKLARGNRVLFLEEDGILDHKLVAAHAKARGAVFGCYRLLKPDFIPRRPRTAAPTDYSEMRDASTPDHRLELAEHLASASGIWEYCLGFHCSFPTFELQNLGGFNEQCLGDFAHEIACHAGHCGMDLKLDSRLVTYLTAAPKDHAAPWLFDTASFQFVRYSLKYVPNVDRII